MVEKKIIFYIDGFNLYNGLKAAGLRKYYWLNIESLTHTIAKRIIKGSYKIRLIRYFTSRVIKELNPEKYKRQGIYLRALRTLNKVKIIKGKYKSRNYYCINCSSRRQIPVEKMTDVNIASMMFYDAYKKYCDIQIIIGGDTDLKPITRILKELFNIKLYILFPLFRETEQLKEFCDFNGKIFTSTYKNCQFSTSFKDKKGNIINKPPYWNY